MALHVVHADPRTDPRWARLVALSPDATVFHSPEWLRAVSSTYGLQPVASLLCDGETVIGGTVSARIDDPRGTRLVSFPFSDFMDPLVESCEQWRLLAADLLAEPLPFRARVRRARWLLDDPDLQTEAIGYWHAVDVTTEDAQWAALGGSARRNIRRAHDSGLSIEIGSTIEQIREFFDLHRQVRKHKYRLLPQPWTFFEQLHAAFEPELRLHVLLARQGGVAVGGILALAWGDTLYYKFNASALGQLGVRPNDLLAWEAIGLARRLGLARLDFGFSDADQPGLVRYKRKFATVESPVHRVSRTAELPPSGGAAFGRDLTALTAILTDPRVPDDLTEAAGALLYHYFA
ncbi:MAG: GNAT family N-acetyltransferase [Dehalococcoidia bacterium]